jgi:predicted nucleotide-binding protein (sugar kinase/HSP70/actin superfamily)
MEIKSMPYIKYKEEMKSDYILLLPNLLKIHVHLIQEVLQESKYNVELLTLENNKKKANINEYSNSVINDYIIALIHSLKDKKFKNKKLALFWLDFMFVDFDKKIIADAKETIHNEFPSLVFININFNNKSICDIKFSRKELQKLVYAFNYGDIINNVYNRYRSYVLEESDIYKSVDGAIDLVIQKFRDDTYKNVKWNIELMSQLFFPLKRAAMRRLMVGVVYSPLLMSQEKEDIIYNQVSSLNCELVKIPSLNYVLNRVSQIINHDAENLSNRINYIKLKLIRHYCMRIQNKMSKRLFKTKLSDKMMTYKDFQLSHSILNNVDNEYNFPNEIIASYLQRNIRIILYVEPISSSVENSSIEAAIFNFSNVYKRAKFVKCSYDDLIDNSNWQSELAIIINDIKKAQQ